MTFPPQAAQQLKLYFLLNSLRPARWVAYFSALWFRDPIGIRQCLYSSSKVSS